MTYKNIRNIFEYNTRQESLEPGRQIARQFAVSARAVKFLLTGAPLVNRSLTKRPVSARLPPLTEKLVSSLPLTKFLLAGYFSKIPYFNQIWLFLHEKLFFNQDGFQIFGFQVVNPFEKSRNHRSSMNLQYIFSCNSNMLILILYQIYHFFILNPGTHRLDPDPFSAYFGL